MAGRHGCSLSSKPTDTVHADDQGEKTADIGEASGGGRVTPRAGHQLFVTRPPR
jgi:hypothetical protein